MSFYPPRDFILLRDFSQILTNEPYFHTIRQLLSNLLSQNKIKLYGLYQGKTIVEGLYESQKPIKTFYFLRKEDALNIINHSSYVCVRYIYTADEDGKILEIPPRYFINVLNDIYLKKSEISDLIFNQKNVYQATKTQDIGNTESNSKEKEEQIAILISKNNEQSSNLKQKDDEITQLKTRIAELEAQNAQLSTAQNANNELSLLFDKNHEYFAPDLAHAVKLWGDVYANGKKKKDSHTNLANTWIEKNTHYDEYAEGYGQTKDRIRAITTPLKDFGAKHLREKNPKLLIL